MLHYTSRGPMSVLMLHYTSRGPMSVLMLHYTSRGAYECSYVALYQSWSP